MAQINEDLLLRNVADLRKKLIRTERNLQLLQTPSPETDDQRYRHRYNEDIVDQERVPPLTLDDLTPEHLTSSTRSADNDRHRSSMRRSRVSSCTGTRKHNYQREQSESGQDVPQDASLSSLMGSSTLQETTENRRLRKKLQALREENTRLVTGNHSLHNKIESCQYELRLTKGQVKLMSLEVESGRSTVVNLKDKCESLRTELKANDSALRLAEQSLDESGRQLSERETLVHRHRQEMRNMKSEIAEEQTLRNRMEAQRDETVQKLEELSDQLNSYRLHTQDQLSKLSASEEHLRGSLLHCDREREELLERATVLEEDLQDARDQIRTLRESGSRLDQTEASLKESRSKMEEQSRRIRRLETDLDSKQRESQELSALTERQSERLVECQKDIENSHNQLHRLEDMVERQKAKEGRERSSGGRLVYDELFSGQSRGQGLDSGFGHDTGPGASQSQTVISELRFQLAMKEVEIQQLTTSSPRAPSSQASHASLPDLGAGGGRSPTGLRAQLAALMEKSKLGEKRMRELEKVIGQLNSEAVKRTNENSRLKQELANSEAGRSSMESRMSLRDTQLSQLHSEIQEKASQLVDLEKEVKKRRGQITTLESQLEEKTSSFSTHVAKLQELQHELDNSSSQLTKAKEDVKEREVARETIAAQADEMRRLSKEQSQELHQQLDLLHQKMEQQTKELEALQAAKRQLQREVGQKEERLTRLQDDLSQNQKELTRKNVENQQLWNSLQSKANEGALRLAQLEASQEVCKQELAVYVSQLEDGKRVHAQEMGLKQKEVADLEDRWKKATVEMEERGLRAGELEQTVRERQHMLQQSTERIADLEDREAQLEQQVSGLSRELSQLKALAAQEAEVMEKKLHQACLDLEDRSQRLGDSIQQIGTLQSDLAQSKAEVRGLEQKVSDARQDRDSQGDKTVQLDQELHAAKVQMEEAQSTVKELEEVLERTREESKQAKERGLHLDTELQQAQQELREAASQLGELHRLLQRSKAESKLKQERVQELNQSLRKSQEETRSKERDIAEIDLALRTSQRELLQRSAQVSQLDVTVKERQSEMERQILQLETSLNKTQYQLKQSKHKVSDLEESQEKLQQDGHKRALEVQELEQRLQQQHCDITAKTKRVTQLEERIEQLSSDLREQKEEYLDQGQQLRLSREQTQQTTVNITELQRQLAEAKRQQDNLSSELDAALERCHIKDEDMARLAEEVGATRAQELALQAQYTSELQQIAKLRDTEVEIKEEEVSQLQASHAQLLTSRDQLDSAHRLELSQLRAAEQRARGELGEAARRLRDLEADLAAAKEVIDATNEAIVIKESEIARLKAKVSGYERVMFASHTHPSQGASPLRPRSTGASPHASPSTTNHQGIGLQERLSPSSRDFSFLQSPTKSDHPSPDRLSYRGADLRVGSAEKSLAGLSLQHVSPGIRDSLNGMHDQDVAQLPRVVHTSPGKSSERTARSPNRSQVKFHDRVDAFSESTETSSVVSGVERLPETAQPDKDPGTFQAMLEFVNRQILTQEAFGKDTDWLDLDDMSDGGLLLSPTRSGRTSSEATWSLSPGSPLKSSQSSPSSRSAPPTPHSPRRKSGIPLRKGASPGRRALHFSKGVSSHTAQTTVHVRKHKGRKPQPSGSDKPADTTPLKQKLANQKAKLASHGKARPGGSSQLKPKECIADLQAKLKANDARRHKIDEELFGVI